MTCSTTIRKKYKQYNNSPLTQEQVEQARQMLLSGERMEAIASYWSVSVMTAYKRCLQYDLPKPAPRSKAKRILKNDGLGSQLRQMAADGLSIPEIAAELKVADTTVRNWLRAFNISITWKRVSRPEDLHTVMVRDLLTAGHAPSDVARVIGIRRQRVEQIFNKKESRCRQAVYYAVRDGRLKKPDLCEGCSSNARIEAHHDDYDKPLDVRWLCKQCHEDAHHKAVAA